MGKKSKKKEVISIRNQKKKEKSIPISNHKKGERTDSIRFESKLRNPNPSKKGLRDLPTPTNASHRCSGSHPEGPVCWRSNATRGKESTAGSPSCHHAESRVRAQGTAVSPLDGGALHG